MAERDRPRSPGATEGRRRNPTPDTSWLRGRSEIPPHGDPGPEVVVADGSLMVPDRLQSGGEVAEHTESHPGIEGGVPRDVAKGRQRHGAEALGSRPVADGADQSRPPP